MLPPKPPRRPRLRTVLHTRWLAGLYGGLSLLTLLVIIIAYASYGADLTSFADEALDRSSATVQGEIIDIEPTSLLIGGSTFLSLHYRFADLSGKLQQSRSLLRESPLEPGDSCWIEYLRDDPLTSRLRGTTRQIQAPLLDLVIRWILLPGIVLFMFWLQGVLRLRGLLSSGLATHAKITRLGRNRWLSPPQLRVEYSFLDHQGGEHHGQHWVAMRSSLGQQLDRENLSTPAVIYDEANPKRSRLVDCTGFLH